MEISCYLCAVLFQNRQSVKAESLLRQMQEHDSEPAFRALFDGHYARMFRIAYYYLQDDDLAEEVALDVLAEIWIKRKTMTLPDDFRHYSFVMVRNAAINVWNREHQIVRVPIDDADTPDCIASDSDTELFETYERLLADLPPRCREVFCRIKEDEASYAEVAAAMGISVKTVDAQLQKALRYLREGLGKYLGRESGKRFGMLFL